MDKWTLIIAAMLVALAAAEPEPKPFHPYKFESPLSHRDYVYGPHDQQSMASESAATFLHRSGAPVHTESSRSGGKPSKVVYKRKTVAHKTRKSQPMKQPQKIDMDSDYPYQHGVLPQKPSSYPSYSVPQGRNQTAANKTRKQAITTPKDYYDYYYEYDSAADTKNTPSRSQQHPVASPRQGLHASQKRDRSSGQIAASAGSQNYAYDDEFYEDYDGNYNYADDSRRQGHYGGSGGGDSGGGINPFALLVAPLAGIALLSAAAAVALNPVLVSISVTNGRKRRSVTDEQNEVMQKYMTADMEEKIEELKILESFLGKMPQNDTYQQRMLSTYLSCSGYTEKSNECLDRVVCEYAAPESALDTEEKDVISIVLYHIMSNSYIDESYKSRLRLAARTGRSLGTTAYCKSKFPCSAIDHVVN